MAVEVRVEVPPFRFSGFYYPEILRDLLVFLRGSVPEITDENPHEPAIQLLRAFALVGHYSNVLADHIAQETLLPTARLRESVRAHLSLLAYRLRQPGPSTTDLVLRLSSPLTVPLPVEAGARFGTESTEASPAIEFEAAAIDLLPTNALDLAWERKEGVPGTWTDRTSLLNAGSPFSLWGGSPDAGDCLYFGSATALFDRIVVGVVDGSVPPGALWDPSASVWEYFDGRVEEGSPSNVQTVTGGLKFSLSGFLGTSDRHGGTVYVRSRITGITASAISDWSGAINTLTISGTLGQATPSLNVNDYAIATDWREVDGLSVETSGIKRSTRFSVPETLSRQWAKTAVNGSAAIYWLRLRCVRSTVDYLTISGADISRGGQFVKVLGTQGRTFLDDPVGSSTGLPEQTFATSQADVIEGTVEVEVEETADVWVPWEIVSNFLSSTPLSRHATVEFDPDGRGFVSFGDGVNGKIPPLGTSNIRTGYRSGAKENGNVGAGAIVRNMSGLSAVAAVFNPRPASGWRPADGGTPADLARVKVAGPATALRTAGRAITIEDCEAVAVNEFVTSTGSRPCARALAVEEAFGPKTIGLCLVSTGGDALSPEVLEECEVFFNGDPVSGRGGALVVNSEVVAGNYVPRPINVIATVYGGDEAKIRAALGSYLSPLALKSDGVSWEHGFNGEIATSRLSALMFEADPDAVRKVVLSQPAANVPLGTNELPVPGTMTITFEP